MGGLPAGILDSFGDCLSVKFCFRGLVGPSADTEAGTEVVEVGEPKFVGYTPCLCGEGGVYTLRAIGGGEAPECVDGGECGACCGGGG
jgi:hypothetical protein